MLDSYQPWAVAAQPSETPQMLAQRRNRAYFDWQIDDTQGFWHRIGETVDFENARVLEIGCGHGALSVDIAKRGAAEVVGLDLDPERIEFAQGHAAAEYPALHRRVRFECRDVAELAGRETFDFIVSKDTFEHILDLPGAVVQFQRLLKPGGRLVVGTSPLYYSPFGDHHRYLGKRIPWIAALPEPMLFSVASRRSGTPIRSAGDVGLNKMTPAQFRSQFQLPTWRVEFIGYNRGDKKFMSAFRALRTVGALEKYFTVGIYSIITRV